MGMIGTLAKAVFNFKAKCLVRLFYSNSRVKKSFQTYIDDTEKFKKELKRQGLGNTEDLKKALADDPNLPDWENF